ncbi:SMI1/KNR4 family protein [Streptomyces sp. NPDC102282]|uniref:SMI1/KNR4 family protein n=1 Tax=Streptomyces sp. NPDC102282 TaxID=3366154 RepID=UPI003829056D
MTSTDDDVRTSWSRIDTWCGSHLRGTPVRAVSDPALLRTVETELGEAIPAEVHAWWALEGVGADFWLPGSFAPVDLAEALETREIWLEVAEEEGPSFDADGAPEPRFLPSFLPIATDPGGDGLVVDLRPGDSRGAVHLWDHETWVLGVPLWSSVAAMLRDIATALESGTPALLRHAALGGTEKACVARVDDAGELAWEAADR